MLALYREDGNNFQLTSIGNEPVLRDDKLFGAIYEKKSKPRPIKRHLLYWASTTQQCMMRSKIITVGEESLESTQY